MLSFRGSSIMILAKKMGECAKWRVVVEIEAGWG
jgi:hypothetical protein